MNILRGLATSMINSIDNKVNRSFDKLERKIDNFDRRSQAVGRAIDNTAVTVRDIGAHGLDRNHIDEINKDRKTIKENTPKELLNFIPKQVKVVDKALDTVEVGLKNYDDINNKTMSELLEAFSCKMI